MIDSFPTKPRRLITARLAKHHFWIKKYYLLGSRSCPQSKKKNFHWYSFSKQMVISVNPILSFDIGIDTFRHDEFRLDDAIVGRHSETLCLFLNSTHVLILMQTAKIKTWKSRLSYHVLTKIKNQRTRQKFINTFNHDSIAAHFFCLMYIWFTAF